MFYLALDPKQMRVMYQGPQKLKGISKDKKNDKSDTGAEISPFDENLSYVHYKGTTMFRKTLNEPVIK